MGTEIVKDEQAEACFLGALYQKPDLFIEYDHFIKSQYDFSKEETVFFYDNFSLMYKTFSQDFNKVSITVFMKQDNSRFIQFEKFGGYNTIKVMMSFSNVNDISNYFDTIKKYALLRDFQKITVESIISNKKFHTLNALDLSRVIRAKIDNMQSEILTINNSNVLNKGMKDIIIEFLMKPDIGIEIPFPELNYQFSGIRRGTMLCLGMLSNAGKTRFMFNLIAYMAFVQNQKIFVMLNEMREIDVKKCLLTTVINNEVYQNLHGVVITKNEKEISLGKYYDKTGKHEIDYVEDIDEYLKILKENSPDFNKVIQIAKWIDEGTDNLIFIKDVSNAYDDKTLEFEIRKAYTTQGIEYFFYDTLKNDLDTIGDWGALKKTTTRLQELAKNLNVFVYGSIQLTDESLHISAYELSSNNIANCKGLKHPIDGLVLAKEIDKDEYNQFVYTNGTQGWGESGSEELILYELDVNKRYYIFVPEKNRVGEKNKLLFSLDLNTNVWKEEGIVKYKGKKKTQKQKY